MSAHWHIGMEVECIKKGAWVRPAKGETYPQTGGVYTIRSVEVFDGTAYLRLNEILNPVTAYLEGTYECQFRADRFRPVQKRTSDISILKAILLNPHIPVKEDA